MPQHKPTKRKIGRTRAGRFAYEGLSRVFHEKARLSIMTCLSTQSAGLSFSDLKELCSLSDGNLNRHLAVLQEAGFVKVKKEGGGRRSHTLCLVTHKGKMAFLEYLDVLEQVISDAAAAQENATQSAGQMRTGWSTT